MGKQVPSFTLKDSDGRSWTLEQLYGTKDYLVVVFLGTECPIVKLYADRLQQLATEFADQPIQLVGINSNQQDSIQEIQHFVRTRKLTFPVLKDVGNRVADDFGATRTPEAFVLDRDRRVFYHGAIDNQFHYEVQRTSARDRYLVDALESLVNGERVATPETESGGLHYRSVAWCPRTMPR